MNRIILAISVMALLAAGCGTGTIGDAGPVPTQPPGDSVAVTTTIQSDVGPSTTTTEPATDGDPVDNAITI